MKPYDFIIVGAGLFGAVVARELTDAGLNVVVIEKRNHTGGNCFTKDYSGINVHMYGPHIFHTSNLPVWEYLNKHTSVNHFKCAPKIKVGDRIFSFPINLMTLNQLWKITTPGEAKNKLKEIREDIPNPQNAEEWGLANVGRELYEMFYKDYIEKQWGRPATEVPSAILARQVVRTDYNDSYYYDPFQGIPDYTKLFESLLSGITVKLGMKIGPAFIMAMDIPVISSGRIDEFYGFMYGKLEYRSLYFEHSVLPMKDFQGVFMVSYPESKYSHTRIIEHKHFEFGEQDHTVITKEYPLEFREGNTPFYPVGGVENKIIYEKYIDHNNDEVIFGGRLGSYRYMNMDETINQALEVSKKIIDG